jgi:hypothetical protein
MRVHSVFESNDYRDFVKLSLQSGEATIPRGVVKKLAQVLKCHPSYVSQVLNQRAHFSNEQGIGFCHWLGLNQDETEFFVNLLNKDRAGTPEGREHFGRIIQRQLEERDDLKKRWKTSRSLDLEPSLRYYETWMPQALHMLAQIDGYQTVKELAAELNIEASKATELVKMLEAIGVLSFKNGKIKSQLDSVHLAKNSPMQTRFLTNWRLKAIDDFNLGKDPEGVNYTSVVSLSAEAKVKIKKLIYSHLEDTRNHILKSRSEQLCVYNLDFYSLKAAKAK